MSGAAPTIRPSRDADVAAIAAIYAHHVRHGVASFEEAPPDVEEIARRRAAILEQGLPYLVAEREGRVIGYCYAGLFRPRSGYRFTLEDSIYIDAAEIGRGVGRALLEPVIARCSDLGYRQMVAVIGGSETIASIRLHAALGFAHAGLLPAVGFKFGRWIDVVLMQRTLGPGAGNLPG
ncbi:MAG TPA: GNAT family N-acetyltransferase [Stellaceae bacterium]|nr:GNAT family N-acetyltransferase [Stellaceae bacterium]